MGREGSPMGGKMIDETVAAAAHRYLGLFRLIESNVRMRMGRPANLDTSPVVGDREICPGVYRATVEWPDLYYEALYVVPADVIPGYVPKCGEQDRVFRVNVYRNKPPCGTVVEPNVTYDAGELREILEKARPTAGVSEGAPAVKCPGRIVKRTFSKVSKRSADPRARKPKPCGRFRVSISLPFWSDAYLGCSAADGLVLVNVPALAFGRSDRFSDLQSQPRHRSVPTKKVQQHSSRLRHQPRHVLFCVR